MKSLIEEAENLVHLNVIMKADCPIKIENPKAHDWLVNFLVEFAEKQVKNCNIHDVSGSWVYVNEETPPNDVELLAKAPDGTIHLTSWRTAYDIFSCQCKSESAFDWQWKLV